MKELRQLMAAYFHQDWCDEYDDSWEAAVDDFVLREPSRVAGVGAEIKDLLARATNDTAVDEELERLGNCRFVNEGQDPYRSWLRQILMRLESDGRP